MQHSIQQTREQSGDPSLRLTAPTAVMEQLRDRIRHISQGMHVSNRSCCVEMATSSVPQASRREAVRLRASQTRLPRSTQKRRRRTQRRRRRSEKRACSDTIEESSSADEVDARRKRARDCKESPSRPLMYIQSDTSLLLHITTARTHGPCSCDMWYHERTSVHFTVARSLRLKSGVSHDLCQSSPALAPLSDFAHGCAGVRFGEARNPGPATHDRDRTAEQRNARHRRINEAGDSVPGSQDSLVCRKKV